MGKEKIKLKAVSKTDKLSSHHFVVNENVIKLLITNYFNRRLKPRNIVMHKLHRSDVTSTCTQNFVN